MSSRRPRPNPRPDMQRTFCHECDYEWFRQEYGLTCPACGSNFVELIETGERPPAVPPMPQNAAQQIPQVQANITDAGYTFATFFTTPNQPHNTQEIVNHLMQIFPTMFPTLPPATNNRPHQPGDPNTPRPNAQIYEPRNIMGMPPFQPFQHNPPQQNPPQQQLNVARNSPLAILMGLIFGGREPDNSADYLHSQQEFDNVISELMEQYMMTHVVPPAPVADIASLPKVPMTEAMLGDNGQADCPICMETVELGEHVTKMHCDHWFHEECITTWLREHNTCPICRRTISQGREGALQREERHPPNLPIGHEGASGAVIPPPAVVPAQAAVSEPAAVPEPTFETRTNRGPSLLRGATGGRLGFTRMWNGGRH